MAIQLSLRGSYGAHQAEALPVTRKWQQVVAMLGNGSPVAEVARASADAAGRLSIAPGTTLSLSKASGC